MMATWLWHAQKQLLGAAAAEHAEHATFIEIGVLPGLILSKAGTGILLPHALGDGNLEWNRTGKPAGRLHAGRGMLPVWAGIGCL